LPTVSVVLVVHNGRQYLAQAIESVLAQTLGALELLAVDDASTDDTPAILEAYAARDARVRVLLNARNLGPYPSANRALQEARGTYVARIDADDLCEPERLSRQVHFMEANPRCLLLGSGYRSIDGSGRTRFVKLNPMTPEVARWTVRLVMPMVRPSFCFRRVLPDGTAVRYDESLPLAADYALAANLGAAGMIASLGDPLVRYRMHEANISSTRYCLQKDVARRIAGDAVRQHYPPQVAASMEPLLDLINRRRPVAGELLRQAIAGMDAALAHDGGARPPRWMRERAAGILAQACLGQLPAMQAARLGILFWVRGHRHLLPLLTRIARTRQLLAQDVNPES
jgi:glycosyltransferase involved in cell wall biosynthesis